MARGELTSLLRYRRTQIDPADVGLTHRGGRGRKAVGLSQAQVAQLLFRTERWYGQFERGGVSAPHPDLLEDVARVLHMSEHERAALYLYALGQDPPDRPAGTPREETAQDVREDMPWLGLLDDVSPHPVAVTDVAWNVIAHNRRFEAFHDAVGGPERNPATPDGFNLLRWQLLDERARDVQLLDWETGWARTAAARLRYSLARHPNNRCLREIEEDVLADPRANALYRDSAHTFEVTQPCHPIHLEGWGSGSLVIMSMRLYSNNRAWLNIMVLDEGGTRRPGMSVPRTGSRRET
ncbi:helix-turn-helix domain-containing protein [Streptomyces sp. NPDC048737]|uniref:MmyB family transcriptional regulator n=1 Tax=unclassified Streptomyces TaxID=2593676 RepID=UPI00342863FF